MENLVFTLIERGFGWNLIRSLFATLDSVAFWIFAKIMGLMFDVANFTAEANLSDFLEPLQNRVYVILSIYMLFKVTVSLISYIVNPDAMTDKSQGVGKLVQRIIIAMVMLIFFPFAFDMANELQANIVKDGTIARLVLGSSDASIDSPEGMGTEIAFSIYNGTFIYDAETKEAVSEGDLVAPTVEALAEVVNDEGVDRSTYKYGYIPLLGFALGIVLTIITLSMCVDIAIRAFKLIILQLVAPIPILSYIDPKASKDGPFSKWLKMVASVWADLFVRLFIIYFIVLVIEKLLTNGGALAGDANPFVFIALIVGLLFFAKDAPKFIFDSLGIKQPEKGSFSSLIGGAAVGGLAGAGAGLFAGGLGGMAAGALNGLNGGLHGGKVADSLKQGLDLGTQIRTGGEETKYKNLLQKAQQASMQHSAARKLGFRSVGAANKAFGDYKTDKINAMNDYEEALTQYQTGGSFNYQGKNYSGDELQNLIYGKGGLKETAAKTESKFSDFSAHLGSYGMGSKSDTALKKATEGRDWFQNGNYQVDSSKFAASSGSSSSSGTGPTPMASSEVDPMELMQEVQSAAYDRQQNEKYAQSDYNDPYFGDSANSSNNDTYYEDMYSQQYDNDDE